MWINAVIKMSEKRELLMNCWCRFSSATMAHSVEVPQKLKIELSCDPVIPPSGVYPQRIKASLLKGSLHIHVYHCTAGNSKPWLCLDGHCLDKWIKKNVACIHNGLSYRHKEELNYITFKKIGAKPSQYLLSCGV